MNKRQLLREIRKRGWEVVDADLDFRAQDSVLYYGRGAEDPVLTVKKDGHVAQIITSGDIRIYGERTFFIFKGHEDGRLTYHLRKNGRWENNNWFEVNMDGSSFNEFEEPYFDLDSAVEGLLERLSSSGKTHER